MLEKIPGGHNDALHQSVIDARGTDHTLTLNDLPFASLNFLNPSHHETNGAIKTL